MSTVSTDLARRLASAGLAWEPKVGDWVLVEFRRPGIVVHVGAPTQVSRTDPTLGMVEVILIDRRESAHALFRDCLWLPTGDDCLEAIRSRGLFPAVAAYHGGQGWSEYWGAWANDSTDECVVRLREGDRPAEATGLALAAILEGEKEGK